MKRADDTSNFDLIEDEPSHIDISSLTDKKALKHLPFIGFTFTSDKARGEVSDFSYYSSLCPRRTDDGSDSGGQSSSVHCLEAV